jgi:flavin-binding protein dodecin
MSVYKMVEVVGTSGTSVSDAIRGAVTRASQTLDDVSWFEVSEIRGQVSDGEITEYQVKLDIGFRLRAPHKETGAIGSSRADKNKPAGTRQARTARAQAAAKRGERGRAELSRGFRRQPGRRAG